MVERELITQEQFGAALSVFCLVLLGVCVLVGLLRALQNRRWQVFLPWLYAGGFAPLLYGLWTFYAWTVRYRPETGTAGLHRVSVLLADLLTFIAVGAGLGYLTARLFRGLSGLPRPAHRGGSKGRRP